MQRESEGNTFDRLSKNDQEVLRHPQVRMLLRGGKSAVFLGGHEDDPPIKDLKAVSEALASVGIDAMVFSDLIVDPKQVAARVAEEPELAKMVGWDKTKSVKENLLDGGLFHTIGSHDDALAGFVLGFPASAIQSFTRLESLHKRGMPSRLEWWATTGNIALIRQRITDSKDRQMYDRFLKVAKRARNGKHGAYERAQSKSDRAEANAHYQNVLHRHYNDIKDLLRKYWGASEEDIDHLFTRMSVVLENQAGEVLYYFVTSGTGAENSPDILELEKRLEKIEGPITKVVSGK